MTTNKPSITIIGMGAVGGTIAAALGDSGHTPALAARTPFAALSRTLFGQTSTFNFPVITEPKQASKTRWAMLCTKAHDSAGAASWFDTVVDKTTTVAVLQNGVDQVDRIAQFVDRAQILPVVVQAACERSDHGCVKQTRPGKLFVPDTPDGREFASLFQGTEALEVIADPDFTSALWRKLAINATTGAICALTLRANEVVGVPNIRELAERLMAEVMAVGRAEGARFDKAFISETLDMLAGPVGAHWTSMAVDRREGRPMEWQVRNAVIGERGRRHGIATPVSDLLTVLLSACR